MNNSALESTAMVEKEKNLIQQGSFLQGQVDMIAITNDAEYQVAAEIGIQIKTKTNEMVEWFKPLKDMAYKTHKAICEREKVALAPMKEAEKKLKSAMSDYTKAVEVAKREAEARAKKLAQEEADKKLEEAITLEQNGKALESSVAVMEAELACQVASSMSIHQEPPKVSGVSSRKSWKITGIDANKVPDQVMGIPLKVVDEKAVMQLIKSSKGQIQIPGIHFEEESQISFRGGK